MSKSKFIAIRNQADSSTLELFFLDIIQDTYDWWSGMAISKVQEIIDKVNYYKPYKIKCIIDSEGGDAQTGMSIYNFLKRCDAKVEVEIIGLAGSIASVIAMAANKGKLRIARNAFMMIHKAEGMCWGTAEELRKGADLVDLYTSQIVDIYSQRTGKSVEEVSALIANGDYWMAGDDCVAQGFADETFNEVTNNLQIAARLDTNVYKNLPVQIRAQLTKPAEQTDSLATLISNQTDTMKKFFTEIVNAIKGVKPEEGKTITNQIAEAVTVPFDNLAQEIETTVTNKVTDATGDALVDKIVNKAVENIDLTKPEVKTSIDNSIKSHIDASLKAEGDNEVKTFVSNLVTAQVTAATKELKDKNTELEKDITNLKGNKSQADKNETADKVYGKFN